MQRRNNDKFAQTVTTCLCSTALFLALRDELFAGKRSEKNKTRKLSGKDQRVAKKKGLDKTRVLILVHTNPNEQNHCPSQCGLITENS